MRSLAIIHFLAVALLSASKLMAADTNVANVAMVPKVAITNLLAHKELYKGKKVEVAGYYVGSFELYALYESSEARSFTNSLWIDPFQKRPGYRQNISGGRADFRGSVRIIGTFDYRTNRMGVGHLGGWPAQITNLELFEKTQ